MSFVSTGQVLYSQRGRKLAPVPKIDCTSEQKTRATLRRVDRWLVEECIAEANAIPDQYNIVYFQQLIMAQLSPADREYLNLYLFGCDGEKVEVL
jgi:hypothetical protein